MVTCRVSQVFARRFAAQGAAMLRQQPARHCSWMSVAGEKTLTDFEKRIMVWGGAFKNRFEVPSQVPHSMFVKCQERFRIKMNIYAMAATAIACTVVMYLGSEEADMPGMSLHAQALRRHAEAAARGSY